MGAIEFINNGPLIKSKEILKYLFVMTVGSWMFHFSEQCPVLRHQWTVLLKVTCWYNSDLIPGPIHLLLFPIKQFHVYWINILTHFHNLLLNTRSGTYFTIKYFYIYWRIVSHKCTTFLTSKCKNQHFCTKIWQPIGAPHLVSLLQLMLSMTCIYAHFTS